MSSDRVLMSRNSALWNPALAALALRIEQSGAEVESLVPDTRINWKEPDVAAKKRPKSFAQTEKKASAKAKRPKKTSRGK